MVGIKYLCLILLLKSIQNEASPLQKSERAVRANPEYRLPITVLPSHYEVKLTLPTNVFTTNTFTGSVTITFTVTEQLQQFKLHSAVTIAAADVSLSTVEANPVTIPLNNVNFVPDAATELITFLPSLALEVGKTYKLVIASFTGTLRDNEMYGFYKSSYTEGSAPTQTTKYLATTQFQPTHARKAFPCFDEPSFKAEFDITLVYPEGYNAVGNTVGDTTGPISGLKTTVFETTPKMSTYLIAFTVSEFTSTNGADIEANLEYKIWSRNEAASTRQWAVDIGPPILHALEDTTGIKFSVSGIGKMDQFAIPDFAAGAMENWGLITYREQYLLWDPLESSNNYKQSVATIIAHEFAHMWFGNLITTNWWSNTFLNEGFATYFEYHSTAEVLPSWELDKQFVIKELHPVLQSDALFTSHALSHEVYTPTEVNSRFNSISYNKGGSIFRMVASFMGSDNFKQGLNHYLTAHQFGNTQPDNLWDSLKIYTTGLPTGQDLNSVMSNWVLKPGFPLLSVRAEGNNIIISQSRFLLSGTDETKWFVPISYTKSNDLSKFEDTSARAWLTTTNDLTLTDALVDTNWFMLNNQQTGYYRVDYDDTLLEKLSAALLLPNFDNIDELNRAQYVDDLFNLAMHSKKTYTQVFKYTEFLANDISYYPWYAAFNAYSNLLQRTGNTAIRNALSTHILNLMQTLQNNLPFDSTNDANQVYTLNKVLALGWACRLGDQQCIDNAVAKFQAYVTSTTAARPDKNMRSIIYCNGLRHATTADGWNFLWNQYVASSIATEKATIISSLGCTTDTELLNSYLQKSITADSGIRRQDALSVFSSVYNGNPSGVDIAFDFLIANYQEISTYYASMNALTSMINGLAARFTTQAQIDKLKTFSELPDLEASLVEAITTALASAEKNLQWTTEFEKELTTYFNLNSNEPDAAGTIAPLQWLLITIMLIFYLNH